MPNYYGQKYLNTYYIIWIIIYRWIKLMSYCIYIYGSVYTFRLRANINRFTEILWRSIQLKIVEKICRTTNDMLEKLIEHWW